MLKEVCQYLGELSNGSLYRLDQREFQEEVEQSDGDALSRMLIGRQRLRQASSRIEQSTVALAFLGMLLSRGDSPVLFWGSVAAIIATPFIHGRPSIVLDNQIELVNSRRRLLDYQRSALLLQPGPI